jgi:hypothetical protein
MSDPSGSASYTFDARGRLIREAKTITGASAVPFVTNMAYDSADRMTRRDYPDGEQVTTTYNSQGLPNTLKGSQTGLFTNYTYISGSSYNAAGQDKSRILGTTPALTT